jgi:AcrR family transcriptional regulator
MEKKDHIINEAMKLFAEKGFEGTSIREIAAEAGVNLAMINYYFGSKEKLFECMVKQKAAYAKDMLEEIIKDAALTDIEKFDRIIDGFISRLFTNRLFHRVIHQELMLSHRESLQQAIVNILYPNSALIKSMIDGAVKKGAFKKVDSALVIASLIGTINQILLSKKMCNKLLDKEENYVPYEDAKFKKRVSDHLKEMMHAYLLKN